MTILAEGKVGGEEWDGVLGRDDSVYALELNIKTFLGGLQ